MEAHAQAHAVGAQLRSKGTKETSVRLLGGIPPMSNPASGIFSATLPHA